MRGPAKSVLTGETMRIASEDGHRRIGANRRIARRDFAARAATGTYRIRRSPGHPAHLEVRDTKP